MRLSLRFLVPLLVTLALAAYADVPFIDRPMQRWFSRDLDVSADLIATSPRRIAGGLLNDGSDADGVVNFSLG